MAILACCVWSCKNKTKVETKEVVKTTEPVKKKEVEKPPLVISYTALPLKKSDSGKAYFKEHFTEAQKGILYALNRVDAKNALRPDTLIIPDTFINDLMAYSPFPLNVPELESVRKLIIFSYPVQAFVVYENGKQIKWGPTSMGAKAHPTPTGLHFSNWKSKKSISSVKSEWILPWNFNIVNNAGVGWHEYSMPGYPASHSCLRLHEEDAKWLYNFADQWILKNNNTLLAKGTPVIVFGEYPFGQRRPWLNSLDDPKAILISNEKMKAIIEPYLQEILKQQKIREKQTQPVPSDDTAASAS